jgi:disulfide bond formation protein DsbB
MGGAAEGPYLVENLTPWRIELRGAKDATLVLAPFERRMVDAEHADRFDWEKAARGGQVRRTSEPVLDIGGQLGGLVLLVIVGIVAATADVSIVVLIAIGLAAAVLGLWIGLSVRGRRSEAWLWAREVVSLMTVIVIGLGVPTAAIWLGTDLPAAAVEAWERQAGQLRREVPDPVVVARALQWLFIVTASLVPALLYYLFDRQQLRTLHDRFIQHAFRLDGSLSNLYDLEARYGAQVEETYGSEQHRRGGARLASGRRLPVVLATALLTLGWTVALLRPELSSASLTPDSPTLVQLFQPERSVVTFAFLGAYVFTLEVVVRGYLRGDLRPKTYTRIAVRLLTVVAVAFVLDTLAGTATESTGWLVAAFVAGVFPDWGLQIILERAREVSLGRKSVPSFRIGTPLTELEEIDVFDRSTLGDEGVTNVEALAHHDLIDLMLQTRISAPRLIDWVDQAILRLYAAPPADTRSDRAPADAALFSRIRPLGLRTATQLLAVYRQAEQEIIDDRVPGTDDFDRAALHRLVGLEPRARPSPLDTLVAAIRSEEWPDAIQRWRTTGPHPHRETCVIPCAAASSPPPGGESPDGLPSPAPSDERASAVGT